MLLSQLPLRLEPLITTGRYTLRSIAENRAMLLADQPVKVDRMISAARGHTEPAQPACSAALRLVWLVNIADQASLFYDAYRTHVEQRGWQALRSSLRVGWRRVQHQAAFDRHGFVGEACDLVIGADSSAKADNGGFIPSSGIVIGRAAGQLDHRMAEKQRRGFALLSSDQLAPVYPHELNPLAIEPSEICSGPAQR